MHRRLVLLIAVALLLQGCAASMLRTGCLKPRVSNFGAPTSHVIVLPHGYAGADEAQRRLAQQLNELARLQALQAAARMPLTQVTFVEGAADDPACDIEEVYDRVVEQRTLLFWRKAYHSAVFVWGEVFAGESGLQLQSQLRVYWNGDGERGLQLERVQGERRFRFHARLPSDTVRLPIFAVSAEMQEGLRRSLEGLPGPPAAPPPSGAACAGLPDRFSVERWKPPWLRIVPRDGAGCWLWVDPDALDTGHTLRHVLLGRALAAYLSHRVQPDPTAERAMREALAALRQQLGPEGRSAAAAAMAWAEIMEATANWTEHGAVTPVLSLRDAVSSAGREAREQARAAASLRRAAELLPHSAEAQNLAALGALQQCCDGPQAAQVVREVHARLLRAHQLDDADATVLANRVTWHRLLKTLPAALLPFAPDELDARLARAVEAQAAWQRFGPR